MNVGVILEAGPAGWLAHARDTFGNLDCRSHRRIAAV